MHHTDLTPPYLSPKQPSIIHILKLFYFTVSHFRLHQELKEWQSLSVCQSVMVKSCKEDWMLYLFLSSVSGLSLGLYQVSFSKNSHQRAVTNVK